MDNVNHPEHYTEGFAGRDIECIDITQYMGFCSGNAFKYIWRAGKKGDRSKMFEDIDKACWYLNRLVNYELKDDPVDRYRAQAVFDLIKILEWNEDKGLTECNRYRALEEIVRGRYREALWFIRKVQDEEYVKNEH